MSDHTFCRYELSAARAAAKTAGVSVPKRITAIQSTRNLYFVEADRMKGEYVKADRLWRQGTVHLQLDWSAAWRDRRLSISTYTLVTCW